MAVLPKQQLKPWSTSRTLFLSPWGNLTLARRDTYLNHLKNGIKLDTLTALRTVLQIPTLFPDAVIKRAEEEVAHYDSKGQWSSSYARGKDRYHPYERVDKKSGRSEGNQDRPAWKNIGRRQFRRGKGKVCKLLITTCQGATSRINDNYCVTKLQA